MDGGQDESWSGDPETIIETEDDHRPVRPMRENRSRKLATSSPEKTKLEQLREAYVQQWTR